MNDSLIEESYRITPLGTLSLIMDTNEASRAISALQYHMTRFNRTIAYDPEKEMLVYLEKGETV